MADDIVIEARERFEASQEGSNHNREAAEEDIRFARLGEQWPESIKRLREKEDRPCLTLNLLPAFIRQVVNDARQMRPALQVGPADNSADVNTARVINGLIRSIERQSSAHVAYDTAVDNAVTNGFGFFRISTDYSGEDTFDLEARIGRISNPLSVHWDTNSTEFDASDWEYAFVSDFLTEEQFGRKYPKASKVDFEGDGAQSGDWIQDDQIRVSEYWLRKEKTRKLLLLSGPFIEGGPIIIRDEDYNDEARALAEMAQISVVRERDATYHELTRYVISGAEVLEEEEWPGSLIPIVPVWGEEIVSDGRRHFRSMIRDAMDPQRMYNFWRTSSTELVALAPKAPWVGPRGFIPKGHEQKWETANTRSHAYLEYEAEHSATPPQRQPFAGVPAGAIQEAASSSDDIKAIVGIYNASLGRESNEKSGRAILARERQSDVSNFHFLDNLARSIEYAGKVLVEIIPHIYSTQQSIRILGEDMREEIVQLVTENPPEQAEEGERPEMYNLSVGKYDVTVKQGPSYSTQREETREMLIEIIRAVGDEGALVLGDILMEHMDFVGSEKVAERLKYMAMARGMLPPSQMDPEMMAQLQGQQQPGGMQPGMPQPGMPQQGMPQEGMPPGTMGDPNQVIQ